MDTDWCYVIAYLLFAIVIFFSKRQQNGVDPYIYIYIYIFKRKLKQRKLFFRGDDGAYQQASIIACTWRTICIKKTKYKWNVQNPIPMIRSAPRYTHVRLCALSMAKAIRTTWVSFIKRYKNILLCAVLPRIWISNVIFPNCRPMSSCCNSSAMRFKTIYFFLRYGEGLMGVRKRCATRAANAANISIQTT